MKIVYFNYLYDLYGASIGSTIKGVKLMEALQHCGHEVKMFWRKEQPTANGDVGTKAVARQFLKKHLDLVLHEPNQIFSNLRHLYEEHRILREEKPDLIVARLDVYMLSAVALAKKLNIPLVLEVDSPEVYEFRKFNPRYWRLPLLLETIEAYNLRQADACITVSNKLAHYFQERGLANGGMHVISNGADLSKFNPEISGTEIRAKYALENAIVIGFIGSFHFWHGIENLITLMQAAMAQDPRVKFLLVGDGGPMKPLLEKFVMDHGLQKKVTLTGHVVHDEVGRYIAAMDVVLAPYPPLDFFYYSPVKIYEYMACGKPVLSSRLGQIAEIIRDGENGLLASPGDHAEYARQLARLLADRELRPRLGAEAHRTVAAQHTWEHKARAWSDICKQVLHQYRKTAV